MAITRADSITQTAKKIETYSDFPNNFTKHPMNNELLILKNEDSIRQSIKNCILTNIGERFFDPYFGSNINRSMFENFGPFMVEDMTRYISKTINDNEPRATLLNVQILNDPDKNTISVNIVFSIINNPQPITMTLFLKRVR